MYDYNEAKRRLSGIAGEAAARIEAMLPDSAQGAKVRLLQDDIEADFHMIVVLGEFKRGKSTFVNALLGEEVLPVDVTPTTATINAIFHGTERKYSVYRQDGSVEEAELRPEGLRRFTADGDEDLSSVKYVKVQLSAPMLGERGVIVDTPGVNDLNKQRMDVTYEFVPRADAVLFMLDATAPVKRSEAEFLTDTILKDGLDRIVFIANFFDQVDEDEQDGLLRHIELRLKQVLGVPPRVVPFSAREALRARVEQDAEGEAAAGFHAVTEAVEELVERGRQSDAKLERYKARLHDHLAGVRVEAAQVIAIKRQGLEDVGHALAGIRDVKRKHETIRLQMAAYVADRAVEMKTIVHKSFAHFESNLAEDVRLSVMGYTGTGLKDYVEQQLPMTVKRRMKQWVEQYMPAIHKLMSMLEHELAVGLATEFNANIARLAVKRRGETTAEAGALNVMTENLTGTQMKAGFIAGGVGVVAALMGGIVLLPLVSMAGFPVLQSMMLKQDLDRIKQKLMPELNEALRQVCLSFRNELDLQLESMVRDVEEAAYARYEELVNFVHASLEREAAARRDASASLEASKARLESFVERLDGWMRELDDIRIQPQSLAARIGG